MEDHSHVHIVEAADEANRNLQDLEDKSPLVVQPSVVGGWTSKPLNNDRFVKWVLEALETSGHACANKVTGHSAKCTTLSWLSKAGASVETRTVLGHHALPGFRSAETYSRDLVSAPLRELDRVLSDVRLGHFMPDLGRSGIYNPDSLEADGAQASERPGSQTSQGRASLKSDKWMMKPARTRRLANLLIGRAVA